jgi:hypothetical protein
MVDQAVQVQSAQELEVEMGPAEGREPEEPLASMGDLLDKGMNLAELVDRMTFVEVEHRCLKEREA